MTAPTPDQACVLDGCEKPRKGKYLMCSMHLSRKYGYGDPNYTPDRRVLDAAERRFWKLVDKTETCWLWTGRLNHG